MNNEQLKNLEANLWRAADALRANSDLKASEYSTPVLGLIFLKFADNKYKRYEADILAQYRKPQGTRLEKTLPDIAIEKCGFYLPDTARYDYLLRLPEQEDIAAALKTAMQQIALFKPELEGVLPEDEYFRLTRSEQNKSIPNKLLRIFADIPEDFSGDMFGQIYEYFLGEFAMSEGQGGGEFFTPRSVVRLMVEVIEPHGGRVFDPACGSGGMFVQSAQFVEQHRSAFDTAAHGEVKTAESWFKHIHWLQERFPKAAYEDVMTSRATIGAIGINLVPACTNQGFIVCVPNERYPLTFLYHWLKRTKPFFEMLSGGATFPELNKGTFKKIEILSPEKRIVEAFDKLVAPMFKTIEELSLANQNLEKTRGMLLPRLISGKLPVDTLDIHFPPSMQDPAPL